MESVSEQSCVVATPSRIVGHFIEFSDTKAIEISEFQEALCSEFGFDLDFYNCFE
jgi:hypothetical protein